MMSRSQKVRRLNDCVAHNNVLCLALGRKSGRVMATGGDDKSTNYVNMWAIGRPDCIMSLSGHTSPIEAVEFNLEEDKVAAGSMSGSLKVWDLEEKKVVRTLSGHGASIRTLDFHYAGYIGSGSMDTNVKLWDIRTKGCIYTYKGHNNGINMLRFSPDGRWFASADEEGIIKMWDLSAGKLLTEFRQHSAAVHCITFHPTELLLASSASDRTVKFFDLERFELISSTPASDSPSAIRRVAFHPEGNCIYASCGEFLKVYTYEPAAECLETIPVGWRSSSIIDMTVAPSFNQLIAACPPAPQSSTVCTYVIDARAFAPFAPSQELPTAASSRPVTVPAPASVTPSEPARPPTQAGIVRPVTRSGQVAQLSSASGASAAAGGHAARKNFQKSGAPTSVQVNQEESDSTPSTIDGDEDSYKVMDPAEYQRIFKPRHALNRSPDPDDQFGDFESEAGMPSPPPPPPPPPAAPAQPATRQSPPPEKASSKPQSMAALIRQHSGGSLTQATPVPDPPVTAPPQPPQPSPTVAPKEAGEAAPRGKPNQVAVEDFLPKTPADLAGDFGVGGSLGGSAADLSDNEVLRRLREPHASYQEAIECRRRNLQSVRTMWSTSDVRTAVNLALSQHDPGVLVDVLNVLTPNHHLWSLDLAVILLPHLANLIHSRYSAHVESCCQALKILLRKFSDLIRQNLKPPPSIGVDLSREERHQKCSACYSRLCDIRDFIEGPGAKPGSVLSKVGPTVKELQLMMHMIDHH